MESEKIRDIAIIIYTYDRYQILVNLLNSIQKNLPDDLKVKVYIFDDCSPQKQIYHSEDYDYEIQYHRFPKNNGRFKFYELFRFIFKFMKKRKFKYFFFLNDDEEFVDDGINKAISLWHSIKDPKKIAMNIRYDRKPFSKWVPKTPVDYNQDLWKAYWIDTSFMCQYNFIKMFNFDIDKKDFFRIVKTQKYSSGVGRYLSVKVDENKLNLYLVKSSIMKHLSIESKMNPEERKVHKLQSII